MSNTPHELHEEFPEHAEAISVLKQVDNHFARMADKYHDLNRRIHRAETNVEPMEDLAMIELRKERGALKDQLYSLLKTSQPTS
ncbi:YdcH family protein [Pseudooceanicola sp. MF1-13]|uniref:YdcH family protein n=1 Tax=Pseudooceanicola sp. MF1-13 TaxID=3379095 RepID=UPI00389208F9